MIDSRRPSWSATRHGRPQSGVELPAELLDQALLVLGALDVSLGDQNLSVARLHPQESHGRIMSEPCRPPGPPGPPMWRVLCAFGGDSSGCRPGRRRRRSRCSPSATALGGEPLGDPSRLERLVAAGPAGPPEPRSACSPSRARRRPAWRCPGISTSRSPSKNTSMACSRWPPVITTTLRAERVDPPGQVSTSSSRPRRGPSSPGCSARPQQRPRLGQVRGDHGGAGQQQLCQRARARPGRAAGRRTRRPSPGRARPAWPRAARRAPAPPPRSSARSPSIPILTASTPMSLATARTWAMIISGGIGWTAVTPTVFWAVIAVIAVMPCTPQAANAFRSAWMPAPPPESEPAIERTRWGAPRSPRVAREAPS